MTHSLHFHHPQRKWSSAPRRQGWMPRVSTVRLVALVGIAVALFGADALEIDLFPRSGEAPQAISEPWVGAVPERAVFTLCERSHGRNCVVDGDTIRYHGVKIRLSGIDTPEIAGFKCASELALGQRARDRLLVLINAGPFVVRHQSGRDEDRYGRKLRTIERNGRSLGDDLVAEGLARRWDGTRRSWCG